MFGGWGVHHVECRDTEQLTRTFGITGGNNGRTDPKIAAFVEEAVNSLRQTVTYTSDCTNDIGTRAQMRVFAQVLDTVTFRCHRVRVRVFNPAHNAHLGSVQFQCLSLTFRFFYCGSDNQRTTRRQALYIGIIG